MRATCAGSIERFFEPMHTTARAERVSHLNVQGYIARAATVPEGWPSGLRRTLGKRVYGKPYRGFESHSLRQKRPSPSFAAVRCNSKSVCILATTVIFLPLDTFAVLRHNPRTVCILTCCSQRSRKSGAVMARTQGGQGKRARHVRRWWRALPARHPRPRQELGVPLHAERPGSVDGHGAAAHCEPVGSAQARQRASFATP